MMQIVPFNLLFKFLTKNQKPIQMRAKQRDYLLALHSQRGTITEYQVAQRFCLFSLNHLHHIRATKLIKKLDEVRLAKANGDALPIYGPDYEDRDYLEHQPYHALFPRDSFVGFNVNSSTWKNNGIVCVNFVADKMDIFRNRIAGPGTVITQFLEDIDPAIIEAELDNHPLYNSSTTLPPTMSNEFRNIIEENNKEIMEIKNELKQEYDQ